MQNSQNFHIPFTNKFKEFMNYYARLLLLFNGNMVKFRNAKSKSIRNPEYVCIIILD